jgi:hypothetical protein
MVFQKNDYSISSGSHADVFIDLKKKIAYKLFISYDHPCMDGTGKETTGKTNTEEYRKKVFNTEVQAYLNAQKSDFLKTHTPTFLGTTQIESVKYGEIDISNHYLLNCCYSMEFIDGSCEKLNLLNPELLQQLECNLSFKLDMLIEEFKVYGILYTLDSSVIYNNAEFKIIDFGTIDPYEFQTIIS